MRMVTTLFFVITAAFSLVSAASNMSIVATHTTSSGSGNLHQSNGDHISTPQSHKPCPNGSAPDVDGKCQTTVCPNGSAPDVDGNCTRTPSTPQQPPSSLENNSSKILSQPSQLLPSSPTTTTCLDGSSPDTNGNCTPYPLPPDP